MKRVRRKPELYVPVKKYNHALAAFVCDIEIIKNLLELDGKVDTPRFFQDLSRLSELEFNLRHDQCLIMERINKDEKE